MSIFRSEKVTHYQLFLQNEAAYKSIAELGELGCVEFLDLNPDATAFQRTFSNEIRRCNDMERKLRYVEAQIEKEALDVYEPEILPPAPLPKQMIDLEAELEKMESELREINTNAEALNKNFLSLTEMKKTLAFAENFLGDREGILAVNEMAANNVAENPKGAEEALTQQQMQRFRFVAGVVDLEKAEGFERMLWRAGRGNVYLRIAAIDEELSDPATGNSLKKAVFIAFYQGEQLKVRVKKICEGYHASLYPIPEQAAQRKETQVGVNSRLEDLLTILNQTNEHRSRVLKSAAKFYHSWVIKVRKIKGIYHTLNMFSVDVTSKALVAECWIPDADVDRVRQALKKASEESECSFPPILNSISTNLKPPTYFRTNKFTYGFQILVNSYGIANYREVNPGLYTTITFPFLFAVMFGDGGHAFLLTLFAAYLCWNEKKLTKVKGEIFGIIFGGRYIILLMGLFSIYTGFIYNDFFAKSFNIFGSAWRVNYDDETIMEEEHRMLDPAPACPCSFNETLETCCGGHYRQDPYYFGVDPVWVVAENKIVFLNSYKMKLSIIIAVIHMSFGVFLNLWNFTYFKKRLAIFVEFLPRILFFWPLFGYMISLMFLKWVAYGAGMERDHQTDCAPSILITFINMMLLSYTPDKWKQPNTVDCGNYTYMYGDKEGNTQQSVQMACVLVAVLSVPVLLFGTPIQFKMKENKKKKMMGAYNRSHSDSSHSDPESQDSSEAGPPALKRRREEAHSDDGHGSNFGDVMIYQSIHTIEYVLESISHTASYLRLWALSLAHSQLSEVLWFMVLRIGLKTEGYLGSLMIFLTFGFWATLTIAILIAMEGMSAFLHTLRLHWVEFQSKFYKGEGVKFHPFHFRRITQEQAED